MDDQRFDNLTRALATGASRRKWLRMLAGGAAALLGFARGTGEVHGQRFLTAGDPCFDSSQCRAADTPLTCADNGFDYDGPLNCCTYEQGRCFADEGCCGSAVCVDGFCAAQPAFPSDGFRCQNSSQCLSGDRPLYCDYVAAVDDYRCCATEGYWCASNEDCCGWNTCNGNVCGGVPAPYSCTSEWCDCYQGQYDDNPCDPGLFCCLNTNTTGVCMTQFNCQGGSGLPGDTCARYCLPGPTQCPGCISGYCNAAGYCG